MLCDMFFFKYRICTYWPAPSSIYRGLEWSQFLNRLSVCPELPPYYHT